MTDLNDMRYFAEVVGRGSFAAAGRALGVPKSRLSRRIAQLEAELGVRLLQRTTRKLSLTSVGEAYYRHCVAIVDESRAADEVVAQVRSEPSGLIRVVCPITLAHGIAGAILPEFMNRHPQVTVQMEVSNRVVDLVEEGVDVALRVRASLNESGSLVIKRLGTALGVLAASPAQLRRQGSVSTLADLSRLDTVAMSVADGRAAWRLQGPDGAELTFTHRPRYVADDLLTLKYAIVGGVGAGVLPDYMCADELAAGTLVPILPELSPKPGVIHAVFVSRRGMVPAVRAFLDFLGERLTASTP